MDWLSDKNNVIIVLAVCALLAGYIGTLKGYRFLYTCWAGLFLGPLGLLLVVLAKRKEPEAIEESIASPGPQPPQSKE